MVSTLSDARTALAAVLTGAIEVGGGPVQVFKTMPEKVIPPCVLVGPGDPYVNPNFQGGNFGESLLRLRATVVAGAGTNDLAADDLDDLIVATIEAVDAAQPQGFYRDTVERPGLLPLNGQSFLGCIVNVSRIVRL